MKIRSVIKRAVLPHSVLIYREIIPLADFVVHQKSTRKICENWIRSSAYIPDLLLTSDTKLVHQQA